MVQTTRFFTRFMGRWLMALLLVMLSSLVTKAAEAYACYTPSNTTLTFYYDNQRSSRTGRTYDLNTGSNMPGWYSDGYYQAVTRVVFQQSFANIRPTSTYCWFYGMTRLQSISNLNYLNTSQVTNMAYMFSYCSALTSLDVSSFSTVNVTDMANMFSYCSALTSLNLNSFSTPYVTNMSGMFFGCENLMGLDLSRFNTARVTNMANMFNGCERLTNLNVSYFNTTNVIDMSYMFYSCRNLSNLNLNSFNTPYVTNMAYMFSYCSALTSLNLNSFSTPYVTNMSGMFFGCENLMGLDLSRFNTARVTNMANMFNGCERLTNLNVSYFNTTNVIDMSYMFYSCRNLSNLNLNSFNTPYVTNMAYMFSYCSNLTVLSLSGFNTANVTNMAYMFCACNNLPDLDLSSFNTANVTNMERMFENCYRLRKILVCNEWSTAAVISSGYMFSGCSSLVGGRGTAYNGAHVDATYAHIDGGPSNPGYLFDVNAPVEAYACYTSSNTTLTFYCDILRYTRTGTTYDLNEGRNYPGWYTDGAYADVTEVVFDASFTSARPTTTFFWFSEMENLQSIAGISNLKTSEVTDMSWMFNTCKKLTSIDLRHFNTAKVTDMSSMFSFSTALTALDLSSFNTSNVTTMADMFMACSRLTSLDVSSFNTSNVTDMSNMFAFCNGLKSLDLSSFNTSHVRSMSCMFDSSRGLVTILVDDGWNTDELYSLHSMFEGCTRLVGSKGTTYDANHVDATYAHIDGGPSNPGYFTGASTDREAYACYTPTNTTLTFYYDALRRIRPGTSYDLNTGDNKPGWQNDGTYADVTNVEFNPSFAGVRPTSTYYWFYNMQNLESITGISNLNTSEVTNMGHMFNSCYKLTSLDLSSFNTANLKEMKMMFAYCTGLTSLDLSSFNTAEVFQMYCMFKNCNNLQTIYAGGGWSTASVMSSSLEMFTGCTSLVGGQGTTYDANHVDHNYARIDDGPSNPGYFTRNPNYSEAYACYTGSNTTLTFYYDNERSSRSGTTYSLNGGNHHPGWYDDGTNASVTKVVFDPSFANVRPTSTYEWFSDMSNLESITGMSYLNTSEVTKMDGMFADCESLTSLDLSSFNTSNVIDMSYMFYECNNLTSLDLSSFNTSKVTDMAYMFSDCVGLTSLDLSSFNTSKVTDMEAMFFCCFNLRTIYVGNGWSTTAETSSDWMFYDCNALVGGQGTTYDENHVDKAYAHIDGGTSNPGYFTAKNAGLRGDVNGDGQVKISDVTALINYLLSGDASAINLQSADTNQDGQVKISDVTALINYLLSGTWN